MSTRPTNTTQNIGKIVVVSHAGHATRRPENAKEPRPQRPWEREARGRGWHTGGKGCAN